MSSAAGGAENSLPVYRTASHVAAPAAAPVRPTAGQTHHGIPADRSMARKARRSGPRTRSARGRAGLAIPHVYLERFRWPRTATISPVLPATGAPSPAPELPPRWCSGRVALAIAGIVAGAPTIA